MQTNVTITFNNLTPEMAEAIIQASLGHGNAPEKVVESEAPQNMSFCNTKSITHDEFEMQDTNAQDAQDEHSKPIDDVQGLLDRYGLTVSETASPGLHAIGCEKTFIKRFNKLGFAKMDFVLSVLCPIWTEYNGSHFHNLIMKDVCAFTDCYYDVSHLDAERLKKQLTTKGRGGNTSQEIKPQDFIAMIKKYKVPGKATLERYNFGYSDGQRLRDALPRMERNRKGAKA